MPISSTYLVLNTLADLAATPGAQGAAEVLGYADPGDGGGGQFYWDADSTEPADGTMCVQGAGAAQGRWRRITDNNTLNFCWFGGNGNWLETDAPNVNAYDNLPAMQRALDYIAKHPQFKTIYVPATGRGLTYYFSDTIHVYVKVSIEGEGNSLYDYPTTFSFQDTAGIRFHYPRDYYYTALQAVPAGNRPQEGKSNEYWAMRPLSDYEPSFPVWQPGAAYAQGNQVTLQGMGATDGGLKRLRLLNISGQLYQADGQLHGVAANCRMTLENVAVFYFKGSGFRLHGNVTDVPGGSNANFWEMRNCVARFNAEHGIHVTGGDINAGNISNFDATSNKYWGVLDESLLSCVWTNVHTNNNGIYVATRCRVYTGDFVKVTEGNQVHVFACLEDHAGQAPVVGSNTRYWEYVGTKAEADWQNDVAWDRPEWDAAATYLRLWFYIGRKDSVDAEPVRGQSNSFWTCLGNAPFSWTISSKWKAGQQWRGGGAIATVRATSNSVFVAPYNEMNQGHILLRGGAILFGGETGTPVLEGTFLQGGGGLSTPNGFMNARGFGSYDNSFTLQFDNYERDLVRTTRSVEFSTGGPFMLRKLDSGAPTFMHHPGDGGKTFFGTHLDRSGKRYQFFDGDVSVQAGNFYAENSDGQLRVLTPFVPIAENQHGTHPAFATAQEAIAWLLSQ